MKISIRDAIHGFITLNEFEQELIQTHPFQRLRFIHQLGTTNWIYPCGNHTRFEHSLGVFHLADTFINKLKVNSPDSEDLKAIDDNEIQIFRTAALLHDIGHSPFSHVGEDMKLFEDNYDHEVMTKEIILNTEIAEKITKRFNDNILKRIVNIAIGENKGLNLTPNNNDILFNSLLTGQCGIDRFDYLLRDSYHLGVMYGSYDLNRITETIKYDDESIFYWEEGGYHALEKFLLARYFMFTEVYFHKTRRILDYHLSQMIKSFLMTQEKTHFPTDTSEYLKLNDAEIIAWMLSHDNEYKEIFLNRKFFKKIWSSNDHPETQEIPRFNELEKELNENFDSQSDFYFDRADKLPYNPDLGDVMIFDEKEDRLIPFEKKSKLINLLKKIEKRRIYASDSKTDAINTFINNFIESRERREK
ncbi:MAG: HD domain-containing protein [Promethearchaeota archaeon]